MCGAAAKRMDEVKAALQRYIDRSADEPADHELHHHLLQNLKAAAEEYAKQVADFTP